ncbi:MAG: hypothetical protein V3U86_11020 [Acidobacteriota bacterium]
MRTKSILTAGLALIATTLTGSPPAYADDFLWLGVNPSGGWADQSNWLNLDDPFLGGFPNGSDDNAFITIPGRIEIKSVQAEGGCHAFFSLCNLRINAGTTVWVSGCLTISCKLTIEPSEPGLPEGKLIILQGGTVVLLDDDVKHEIGGLIQLSSSGSTLRIEGDATLDPFTEGGGDPVYGRVKGQNNDAEIQIERGKTLTNNITVCGMMTIRTAP